MTDYPRWLYQGNDLSRGRIVHDDAEQATAEADGYAEYKPEGEPEPTPEPAKRGRRKAE